MSTTYTCLCSFHACKYITDYAHTLINNIRHCLALFKIHINGIASYIILWNLFFSLNFGFLRLIVKILIGRGAGQAPGQSTILPTVKGSPQGHTHF